MPIYVVRFSGELDGIAKVRPAAGRAWKFGVTCVKCNETLPTPMEVDPGETVEFQGGTTHAMRSCKVCRNVITATIVARSEGAFTGGAPAPVIAVDFRAGEPVSVDFDGPYEAEGSGGSSSSFSFAAFERGDWFDYDENNACSVSVTQATYAIDRR